MAPQTQIPLAATVLGTIGATFWCIQLVPQIYYNHRLKDTEGLPALMMLLWAVSSVPFGVYAIVQNFAIPLQIQPQIFCTLSLVCWGQILRYHNKWTVWKAGLSAVAVGMIYGALEAVLIVTLRGPHERGIEWPMTIIGVTAAILLGAGLLPPYFELWQRKGRVIGINFGFLTIDILGGFFSLMALVTQRIFDPLGSVMFIICILLEAGIFTSHIIWRIRTRKLHKLAKTMHIPFDSLDEAEPYHPPVLRRASIAFARGREDGSLGQFHRRESMAQALGRRGTIAATADRRQSSVVKGVGRMGSSLGRVGTVTIQEEEVGPDDRLGSSSTGIEGGADYGTIDTGKNNDTNKKNQEKKRQPPPGRGESFFRDMNWSRDA